MKLYSLISAVFFASILLNGTVQARESRHFKIETVENLAQAIDTFERYNRELKQRLSAETPEIATIVEIHEITYILEDALKQIGKDLTHLAEVLEELHLATEKSDAATTQTKGHEYLDLAQQFTPLTKAHE
jgi:hypothetical protein